MSEGASSALDAAVRLSMKRSSDPSLRKGDSILITPRAMLSSSLDGSDVSRAIEQCREVSRRRETFLVDVNDEYCEFLDKLRACGSDGTTVLAPVAEPAENSCRMNRAFSIFLLLPEVAMVVCRGNHWEVCSTTQTWHPGGSWALRRIGPSFGSSRQDRGERLHRHDGSL